MAASLPFSRIATRSAYCAADREDAGAALRAAAGTGQRHVLMREIESGDRPVEQQERLGRGLFAGRHGQGRQIGKEAWLAVSPSRDRRAGQINRGAICPAVVVATW
jgi:hypothetical protein